MCSIPFSNGLEASARTDPYAESDSWSTSRMNDSPLQVPRRLSRWAFCLFGLISCSARRPVESEASAVANTTRLWPQPAQIPVCWHTSTDEPELYPEERKRVQTLVTEQFNRTLAIRFVGWHDCDKDHEALLQACLGRFPKPPHCVGLARKAMVSIQLTKKLPKGTFGVSGIGPELKAAPTMKLDPRKIETTAVHEFGHAIGLQHEHARTDSPRFVRDPGIVSPEPDYEISNCADYARAEKAVEHPELNKYLTEFDPDSVMNYCSGKNILSERDIAGINQLYPKP